MKSTTAAKHATAKKILTCPQYIVALYEVSEIRCSGQIDARQATAGPRGGRKFSVCLINSPCPLYPRKRTLLIAIAMSALCQKRTFRAAEKTLLFDHFVEGDD